ncbi:ABC transporter substrate-binding protein [Bosea sp. (in: a-proteobacteria)]|uniref:substrate-binding periplasmic protein n=1 Tax=Bosea sp. (in: a-proteobacteria) TaxID=1871050 RepID=UPI00261CF946|nr:transporter substrate-binding domain-containing protein [Bosea sp. (in: a-proteobacteria)]MCO5089767.1 transporter substrate-binding domain-containing protein [Bosea sp. (in: a-proteobacteria)]
MRFKTWSKLLISLAVAGLASAALAQEAPKPGESPRVDAIRKSGVLRVGMLANPPWLFENTTGGGQRWEGPAWMLANEYARLLGVKIQEVAVSNDTKIPVLPTNQVDITLAPVAETPERLAVVDFVLYTRQSLCMFGLAANERFANAKTIDDLNDPSMTIAYLVGAAQEAWVKERFAKAKLRGQITSNVVPVDEIVARRADAAPVNTFAWVALSRKVKGLSVLPKENNCQDSTEKSQPVGLALNKNEAVFRDWMRKVADGMSQKLRAEELRVINEKM